jgi:hypothetical protein
MELSSNNLSQNNIPKIKYNSMYNSGDNVSFGSQDNNQSCDKTTNKSQPQTQNCGTTQPYQYQYYQYPQQQIYGNSNQSAVTYPIQPGASGVNIQIFNPCVPTPGSAPSYNVNAPVYYPNCPKPQGQGQGQGEQIQTPKESEKDKTTTTPEKDSKTTGTQEESKTTEKSKTEKKEVVELTDDYVKSLESYLNSQDKEIRYDAATQVCDRIEEDSSRRDDPVLTAFINKMLQDPSPKVRFLALGELKSGNIKGDKNTVTILKNIQNSKGAFGQDALDASSILLKMAEKVVEKDVPVKNKKNKSDKESKEVKSEKEG